MRNLALIGVAGLSVMVVGCGGSGEAPRLPTVPVKGIVYVDDKPFGPCTVQFSPLDAESADAAKAAAVRMAKGDAKSDGTFILSTYKENDGAPVGSYKVSLAAAPQTFKPGDTSMPTSEPVPICEPLTVEVVKTSDGKPQQLEIKLKGTGQFSTTPMGGTMGMGSGMTAP